MALRPLATVENVLLFKKIIYLFLAMLGLHCCARAFSNRGEWGYSPVEVCRLLLLQSRASRGQVQ